MKTPITPIKMPLDLKEAAKAKADQSGLTLSAYIYKLIRNDLKPTK